MKNLTKGLLVLSFTFYILHSTSFAQASYQLRQVIVLNEGQYNTYATVGSYDPTTKIYQNFDTIPVRFATDVIIDNGFIYVAADTLLIKYDLLTKQKLTIQTVPGIRELAVWNNQILVTRAEISPLPSYFQVYDKNTLNFIYELTSVSNRSAEVKVINDTAYIAVNGFGSVGNLAVVDLNNQTLNREIDLGPDGFNPENVEVENGKVFTINALDYTNSSVTKYDATTTTFQSKKLNTPSACGASALYLSNVYFQPSFIDANYTPDSKLGVFSTMSSSIFDTLYINKSVYGLGIDSVNARIYVGTTDYFSYGKVYSYDFYGAAKDSFDVNVSPGTFAFDVINTTGENKLAVDTWQLAVYPNPAKDMLDISIYDLQFTIYDLKIYDVLGNEVFKSKISNPKSQINISSLSKGIYILRAENEKQIITKKIVKQ